MEESFNIFNQFASFFYFLIKASAWCSSFSFPRYLFPAASTLRCHRFILHGLFFFTNSDALLRVFLHLFIIQFIFFSISTTCYRYWFLAICCDVCFKLTYIFSNYRWLYACKIIYNRWQVAMPRSDNVRYKFCLVPKISFTYINFIHT